MMNSIFLILKKIQLCVIKNTTMPRFVLDLVLDGAHALSHKKYSLGP